MKKFCIEIFKALAASCSFVVLLLGIRWLLLTGTLAGQVIAALLVIGLLAATVAGAVFIIVGLVIAARKPKECNTKKRAAPGDQDAAHK